MIAVSYMAANSLLLLCQGTSAFQTYRAVVKVVRTNIPYYNKMKLFVAKDPVLVQVCGFKDCKRSGGGVRLEKFINSVGSIVW